MNIELRDYKLPAKYSYPNGLDLPRNLPWDEWEQLMKYLETEIQAVAERADTLQWQLADAINHGRAAYGEKYAQWVDQTSYQYGSLANIAWVGRHVPREERRLSLTFYHHQSVAPLEPKEQKYWLDKAEREQWSGRDLSRAIARKQIEEQGGNPDLYEAEKGIGRATTALANIGPSEWADVVWRKFLQPLKHLCSQPDYQRFLLALKEKLESR